MRRCQGSFSNRTARWPAKYFRSAFVATLTLAVMAVFSNSAQSQPMLYSASQGDDILRLIDATNGTTFDTIPLTGPGAGRMTGFAIDPTSQVSADPATWDAYGISRTGGEEPRDLVSINLVTGATSIVGNTGVAMAGLTFAADGTLYAVSGDGGPGPNASLFTIDLSDGSSALIGAMGAGGDGEAIGFNPDDGLIYHFSGLRETDPIGREIFESVSPVDASTVSTILPEGTPDAEEGLALLYMGDGKFWGSFLREDSDPTVGANQFAIIDVDGNVTTLGHFDHRSKGLGVAVIPEPSTFTLATLFIFGFSLSRRRRWRV